MAGVDPNILEHPLVKQFLENAEGLLSGQKKLVIESYPVDSAVINSDPYQVAPIYVHTFRLENASAPAQPK